MPRYPILIALLLFIISGNEWLLAQGGPTLVEVTELIEREVASGQTFVATVTPPKRAVVGSAVDGRVIDVMVEEGDRVEKDQALAQLLTETISLELEAAEAELELKRQELTEMENGSLPTEIEQARARMERARVASEFRQKDLERLSQLIKRNAASDSELDTANSIALEAIEAYEEAKAAYQLAIDGPRQERLAQARRKSPCRMPSCDDYGIRFASTPSSPGLPVT